jgi:hypothetical protein
MGDEHVERRRETRIPVEADASIASGRNSPAARAKSINMTSTGVLLRFDEPVSLAVGERVTCRFTGSHEPPIPLPYWGLGRIVRVDAANVAVELQATGLTQRHSKASASPTISSDGH